MVINESVYADYLAFLLSGNKAGCARMVQGLIEAKVSVKVLYLDLFQRSMYQIGKLWEENQVSMATEQMATAITEGLLQLVYPLLFAADHVGKSAIVACVPLDFHQIGAKMVADIFELNGWDGCFVGANTPTQELLKSIDEKKPDIVALSMCLQMSLKGMEEMLQGITHSFPLLHIIVGGQGFLWGGAEIIKNYPQTQYVESIDSLERIIKTY
jgi:MerR family transcriptional regulator, light-induced transcriptional regulator